MMNFKPILLLAFVWGGCSAAAEVTNKVETCNPVGNLVLSGRTLYGSTAANKGVVWDLGYGDVFKVDTNGTGFAIVHSFSSPDANFTNEDGDCPNGDLLLSGNTFFGTASQGGGSRCGTVFRVNTNGRHFRKLHSFSDRDGGMPRVALVLSGDTLYGVARGVWQTGGSVFKINTDGTGFDTLHSFTKTSGPFFTNSDGAQPQSKLILSGQTLYGTTWGGGAGGNGTIFKVNTDGTGFDVLHHFNILRMNGDHHWIATNNDGEMQSSQLASSQLVMLGNTLYGITPAGGMKGYGTLFKINPDGSGFTVLHQFDGAAPWNLVPDTVLYGLCARGIFKINLDGTGFSMVPVPDIQNGITGVIKSGEVFYGTTPFGGSKGGGVVFKVNADGTGFTALHSFIEKPLPGSLTD